FDKGYKIPVHVLSQKVANLNQIYTQHAYMRLHACCGIFIGMDEELKAPQIYRFDPAGWFVGCKACAIGSKEQEGTNLLEKVVRNKKLETEAEVLEAAIGCLQSVLSVDFKPNEVEVGLVTLADPKFRLLNESEIEEYLNRIAERD
ncbi:proteasome subunit alpha type-6-like, partial [Condylostylus longicornis]|uniref:proteasome subunit alpha type-6-like n=1 Tax=Condylostylus longicornis TaxID=2530218 RepID=UPI00244DE5D8